MLPIQPLSTSEVERLLRPPHHQFAADRQACPLHVYLSLTLDDPDRQLVRRTFSQLMKTKTLPSRLKSDAVLAGQPSKAIAGPETAGSEYSSNYGSIAGDEFPTAVYKTVVFAFVWMMLAAWLAYEVPSDFKVRRT